MSDRRLHPRPRACRLLLAAVLAVTAPWAAAQDAGDRASESERDWNVRGGVTLMSDYIWRGVSQTQEDPALQAEINLEHRSGFYAGLWGSSIDFTAPGEENDGVHYELDGYVGWAGELRPGLDLDVVLTRAAYPGAKRGFDYDYTELEGTLSFAEHYHVGLAYSPDIFGLGGKGYYWNVGGEWPLGESGFGLKVQVGYYDLQDPLGDSYNDYLLAVTRDFGPFHAELQYTTTSSYGPNISEGLDDKKLADDKVAVSVGWKF
ncbi:TorF family putative porin [Lysobacter sp. K5869]|uniref:TorF family putative porin n=1 Tax=Lysobacter sp. K5869 TaxID=2820808 RepID=UPI001C064536|nr:TorF family putative porin [Lysobacter sp. K5869]QWP75486.1 TorF family putative porin [Lysobacter sp. K5869]